MHYIFRSKAVVETVVWFSLPKAVTDTYEVDHSRTKGKYWIQDFIFKFVDYNKNTRQLVTFTLKLKKLPLHTLARYLNKKSPMVSHVVCKVKQR
jgi:hypothetical protein